MSEETEQKLMDWRNDELDTEDNLHHHFTSFGAWGWCEISEEARRIHNLMFDDEVEEGSIIDGMWAAVAAQASSGAYSSVAAALGIDAESLELAMAHWNENQDNPPKPISPDNLILMCGEYTKWLAEKKYDCCPDISRFIIKDDK